MLPEEFKEPRFDAATELVTFTFVRHALSENNLKDARARELGGEGRIGGQSLKTPLANPIGVEQAQKLGAYFKSQNAQFTQVYASTAIRTQQTAKFCLEAMGSDLHVNTDEKLLEQDAGDWAGQPRCVVYQRCEVKRELDSPRQWHFKSGDEIKGESKADVAARMLAWLNQILDECVKSDTHQHIVVFTHGLALKFLLTELLYLDKMTAHTEEHNPIANVSITQLFFNKNKELVSYVKNYNEYKQKTFDSESNQEERSSFDIKNKF
jgi:broad specificity phosphatase PhoE